MMNWICMILIAIFAGVPLPANAKTQGGTPEAVLPEAQYRFGAAIEGETVQHDFILHNKGTADLRIEKIKTG